MISNDYRKDVVIGVDIGGTQIKLTAVSEKGEILAKDMVEVVEHSESARKNRSERLDIITRFIDNVEKEISHPVQRVGICLPGLADQQNQYMYQLPGKLFGLENFNWQEALGSKYLVRLLNDANSALLAEHWLGAARNFSNVILLTLGTGVGGAIIADDQLLQGSSGRAGHIGQMIINPFGMGDIFNIPGSLETIIGDMYVEARTRNQYHTVKDLVDGYLANDRIATGYWLDSVHALSIGLVSLINILDPEAIIIGGGIAEAGKALFEPLQTFMERYEWRPKGNPVPILKASFGFYSGAIGAAKFILNY